MSLAFTRSETGGIGAGLTVVAPLIDPQTAERIARERYGIEAGATLLPGEKDSNFRLATKEGPSFFLKVLSPGEDAGVSNMHTQALLHTARRAPSLPLPRIVPTLDGLPEFRLTVGAGDERTVRLTSFSYGRAQSGGERTAVQRREAGLLMARLQEALVDFEHPSADHETSWDMRGVLGLRPALGAFREAAQRRRVEASLERFEAVLAPRLATLPFQVVHNDFGGDNILVDPDAPDRITGLIDFGDMVRTARVFDVAIGAAYQFLAGDDPLAGALDVLSGYAAARALTPDEIALLPVAIETRMAMRVLIPEWRAERFPDRRAYITRNSAAVWHQFDRLDRMAPDEIAARIAAACQPSRS
ncbi:aminotransferase [Aureimonas endophytica]|uniref:Hydroxylysine kinase n=1 Tax=Aureimonas endophytica TaxID=2027858 RepID=A0A917A2L4_9HYPH|nr:phosphotransferase [Aureimonas endophytica]GGE21286.1 aminotransferase [Aureimonas endophytica]